VKTVETTDTQFNVVSICNYFRKRAAFRAACSLENRVTPFRADLPDGPAREVSAVPSGAPDCRAFPRTLSQLVSLRSDSVRDQPGILFGFPSEQRSPSPESAPRERHDPPIPVTPGEDLRASDFSPGQQTSRRDKISSDARVFARPNRSGG